MVWHRNEVEEHFWGPISAKLRKAGFKQSGVLISKDWFTRRFEKWEWIPDVYMPLAFELGLTPKDVMIAIEAYMGLAAKQLKKNGSFKVGNMLNLKLKVIPARRARKGVKAKPAKKTVTARPTKKFKDLIK